MLPALTLLRVDLRSAMALGANRAASGAGNRKARTLLIAGEIALTVVSVAASGLLIRSLVYLETLPPGFDATNVTAGKCRSTRTAITTQPRCNICLRRVLTQCEKFPV